MANTTGYKTSRSRERGPADSLSDKWTTIGGWLPSLTFRLVTGTTDPREVLASQGMENHLLSQWEKPTEPEEDSSVKPAYSPDLRPPRSRRFELDTAG